MTDSAPPAARRVARLAPVDRRGRRVQLQLDDDTALEVALEVIERAGVGVGDPVDEALHARLLDDDLRWRARDAALGFLAHRPRSRGEVRRRLRGTFPPAVVEACLEQLVADGLLDDRAFADLFVRDRLRLKPKGPARLRDELRARGVDGGVADAAIRQGLEDAGTSDETLAESVALRWLAGAGARERGALAGTRAKPGSKRFGGDRDAALRRLVAFLKRRGFGGDAVRRAVAAVDAEVARADG